MRNIGILLLLLVTLTSCDLFKVRDSDPPTKPAPWNNYVTTWELGLQNLEYCFEDSRNAIKYINLFTEDYRFWFSAQDVNDFNLNPSWTSAQEQDMLLNLHSQSDSMIVTLTALAEQPDEISAAEAKIYRKYELLRFPTGSETTILYSGNLELHFRKSGAYWYISKWYDYRAYSHPTWGKLKYDFSQ